MEHQSQFGFMIPFYYLSKIKKKIPIKEGSIRRNCPQNCAFDRYNGIIILLFFVFTVNNFKNIKLIRGKGNFIQLSLSDKLKKYEGVVLFFYPLDFTFVCPTELIKLHEMFDQFHKRGILLLYYYI